MSDQHDLHDPGWDDASASYDGEHRSPEPSTISAAHQAVFDRVTDAIRLSTEPPAGLLSVQIATALDQVPDTSTTSTVSPLATRLPTTNRWPRAFLVAAASVLVVGAGITAVVNDNSADVDRAESTDSAQSPTAETRPETSAGDERETSLAGGAAASGDDTATKRSPAFGSVTDLGDFIDDPQLLASFEPSTQPGANQAAPSLESVAPGATDAAAAPAAPPSDSTSDSTTPGTPCQPVPGDVELGSAMLGGVPVIVLRTPEGITVVDPYGCGRRVVGG